METIETILTTEIAAPILEAAPPLTVTGSIFLPMFTGRNGGLHVITIQTYGRAMRYFTSPKDPLLQGFLRYIAGTKQIKKAASINLGEFYTWEVSYFLGSTTETYYLNSTEHGNNNGLTIVSTPIIKIDELFQLDAPLEFKAAVLNVAFKELAKG